MTVKIFDYDCEIIDTSKSTESLWETPPANESEEFLRRQAMLIADVNLVENETSTSANPAGPSSLSRVPIFPEQKPLAFSSLAGDPIVNAEHNIPESVTLASQDIEQPMGANPKAPLDEKHRVLSSLAGVPCSNAMAAGPSSLARDPINDATNNDECKMAPSAADNSGYVFTMAYSDSSNQKLKYSDIHGKDLSQKERMYMINRGEHIKN